MRKLAIAVALSSTVLATPALAQDSAFYVGAEFGPMIVEDLDVDLDGVGRALTIDTDYGYDGAIFAGYDLGTFRIEVEGAYKKAEVDSLVATTPLPFGAGGGAGQFDGGGYARAMSLMLNGMLDFGDDEGVTGFIGGGLGFARIKLNNIQRFSNLSPIIDDSDSVFPAWQVIAGVRQALSPTIDATLKYRFFNAENVELAQLGGAEAETRMRTHSILGGLTFNFGAAPLPPVIVPPAPYIPPPPAPEPMPTPPPAIVGPFIVFFDWDRSDITPQAAAILDNAASAYQQTGQAQVVLAGHADRSGSADYNVGLSQRRADAVRSYLAGRGVPDGAIATEAFGESRPLVETADGVREPQNRRVEITFGPGSGM